MKKTSLLLSVLLSFTLTACDGDSNTGTATESAQPTEVVETTIAQPSMTEDEAIMRAADAVRDKIDSISPYGIDWGYYDFNRFLSEHCSCRFDEAEYREDSDTYKISTSQGSCAVSVSLYGVDCTAGSPFKMNFSATVTVYSNGDVHVDSFEYDVVER